MSISAEQVKKLRERTGAGIMDCKQALKASENNLDKAIEWLRKQDLSRASKKTQRVASEGVVASYIHAGGRIGVLVEVNSETDFVAKNSEFQRFVKDLSLHIAAMGPSYIKEEDIPKITREKEKEIFLSQAKEKKKNEKATQLISKIGENIVIRRFTRFALGEGVEKKEVDFEEEVKQAIKG